MLDPRASTTIIPRDVDKLLFSIQGTKTLVGFVRSHQCTRIFEDHVYEGSAEMVALKVYYRGRNNYQSYCWGSLL